MSSQNASAGDIRQTRVNNETLRCRALRVPVPHKQPAAAQRLIIDRDNSDNDLDGKVAPVARPYGPLCKSDCPNIEVAIIRRQTIRIGSTALYSTPHVSHQLTPDDFLFFLLGYCFCIHSTL